MTTDNGSASATGRPSGVVADLAVELPVVPHTMPVPEADRMFRRRPALRGVAVQRRAGEDPVLLTRSRLSSELSGAYGYGRALYERRTLHDLVPPRSLVVPDDLSLTSAAQAALERDVHDRYEDVVVRWRDGTVGLLPVTALFERLTGIFRSLALHDALTGLPNRMHLEQVAERRADDGAGAALLYVDLDGFKTVNDIQGHRTGDRLLREFAARLRDCVRPGDVVARLGGDEFALLLPGVSGAEAELVAGRVVRAAAEPFFLGNSTIRIGASVGIAELGGRTHRVSSRSTT